MTIFFVLILALYCVMIVIFLIGWTSAIHPRPVYKNIVHSIAVLIPVRNEENTIGKLLDDLSLQSHKPEEIIVINDHSTDRTDEIVREQMKNNSAIKLLDLKDDEEGKKRALHIGVQHAQTDIIVTSDADCRVHKDWLQNILREFTGKAAQMVVGGVRIQQGPSLFSSMQAMEFSGLIGTGAATLALGFATMSNGANLAFRKEAFKEVNGYEGNFHIASGDDEFLMRKISNCYPGEVRFNGNASSVVTTLPQKHLRDFFYQRIRWASKWRSHRELSGTVLATLIFAVHLSVCLLLVSAFFGYVSISAAMTILLVKAGVEFLFLRRIMIFLNSPWRWNAFFILQVVYSPYVVIFGLLSTILTYRWKERKLPL